MIGIGSLHRGLRGVGLVEGSIVGVTGIRHSPDHKQSVDPQYVGTLSNGGENRSGKVSGRSSVRVR